MVVPKLGQKDDFCMSKKRAKTLARRIEEAWAEQGYEVECIVKPVHGEDGRVACYSVVCPDLVNGLPRGARRA